MTTFLDANAPLELSTGETVKLIRAQPFVFHPSVEVFLVRVRDQDLSFYSTGRPFASTMLRLGADVRLQNRVEQTQPKDTLADFLSRIGMTLLAEALGEVGETAEAAVDSDTAAIRTLIFERLSSNAEANLFALPCLDGTKIIGSRDEILALVDAGGLDGTCMFHFTEAAFYAGRDAEARDMARPRMAAEKYGDQ